MFRLLTHAVLMAPALFALSFTGCKTAEISAAGRDVLLGLSAPTDMGFDKSQCRPLGTVIGKGGGSFGGAFLSNEKLIEYAMNDLRNEAALLGANVVHHSPPQMGMSGGEGTDVSSANITGTAYLCEGEIGVSPNTAATAESAKTTIETRTTEAGGRVLLLPLTFPEMKIALSFTSEQPDTVWFTVSGEPSVVSPSCTPMVMIDGQVRRYAYHEASLPELAFSMPFDDFVALATAQRAVGRICREEWRVDGAVKTEITEFKARIDEEKAWGQAGPQ